MRLIVAITFIIIFLVRLLFILNQSFFQTEESYFHIRQVESIIENGIPAYKDDLSYGGRVLFFLPGFHYLSALFGVFFGAIQGTKIVVAAVNSILFIIIYLLTKKLVKKGIIAYFIAVISSILPIYFSTTSNDVAPFSLFLLLFFSLSYFFLNKKLILFLISLLLISLVHPLTLLFALSTVFYLILMFIEKIKITKRDRELTWFTLFFATWIEFFFHNSPIHQHGWRAIWQNIPRELFDEYFSKIFLATSIDGLGIIPAVLGMHGLYIILTKEKSRENLFIVALVISTGLLVWTRIIEGKTGLIILGLLLTVLFGIWLSWLFKFIHKTKFATYRNLFFILLISAVILSSFASISAKNTSKTEKNKFVHEIDALLWARNLPINTKILAPPEYGHLITYFSNHSNIIDSNYLLQKNIDELYEDIKTVYRTISYTEVVDILAKYGADYILISPDILRLFKREDWIHGKEDCFELIYNKTAKIYKRKCLRVRTYA